MNLLELQGPQGWLRIFCVVVDKEKSPLASRGYQHLRYGVGDHGFSGEGDGFVAEDELRTFCRGLIELADGRDSDPQLAEDPAAGGLDLKLRREPDHARISIDGRITRKHYRTISESDGFYTWATQFGFWIPQDSLAEVRSVRWVERFTR